jgi:hypothetical protein
MLGPGAGSSDTFEVLEGCVGHLGFISKANCVQAVVFDALPAIASAIKANSARLPACARFETADG